MTQEHFIFTVTSREAFAYISLDIQPVEPDAPQGQKWIVARRIVNLAEEEKSVYRAFRALPNTDIQGRLDLFKNSPLFREIDQAGFEKIQKLSAFEGYGN